MIKPPTPANESERLAALRSYEILDTPPEESFDDLAMLAAHICGTPSASISLVDEARQWFKARVGVEARETGRDVAFCAHGILQSDLLIVPDATQDTRFTGNPLVTGAPHIHFYAGAPLITAEGQALGMVCVTDRQPRTLTPEQQEALRRLARQAVAQLELRKRTRELEAKILERNEAEEALRTSDERFRLVVDGVKDHALLMLDPDGVVVSWNAGAERIKGYRAEEIIGQHFSRFYLPEAIAAGNPQAGLNIATREGRYEEKGWRMRKDGSRFLASVVITAIRDPGGKLRGFAKITRDITESERHAAEREMIIAELQEVIAQVKTLSGLIPICGWCKSVRSDKGYWQTVEQYVRSNTSVTFSHGICPSCAVKFKDEIDRAGGLSSADSFGDFDPQL